MSTREGKAQREQPANIDAPQRKPFVQRYTYRTRNPARDAAELRALIVAVMDDGDLMMEIFSQLSCSLTLHRASSTCRMWRSLLHRESSTAASAIWAGAWLTVPRTDPETGTVELTVADALRWAPAGERVHVRAGTLIDCELRCEQPIHLRVDEGVQ